MIRQEKDRIYFFSNNMIDVENTTAEKIFHSPVKKEKIIDLDKPWELDYAGYLRVIKAEEGYRLYYNAGGANLASISECMLESKDGLKWERANVNTTEFNGSKENNIVKDSTEFQIDNFVVFYDENPNCPADEKYKATAMVFSKEKRGYLDLFAYYSADGKTFRRSHSMFGPCRLYGIYQESLLCFDSMNIAFWDKDKGKYIAFVRGFHKIPITERTEKEPGNDTDRNLGIRDIRYAESDDFVHWTEPVLLNYDTEDCPLYTNCISKYAKNIYVGFPTRYTERKEWTDCYDELCSKEIRKAKIEMFGDNRLGLALTDVVFMCSNDGKNWEKTENAYMTPGPEMNGSWKYGSCYPGCGIIETVDLDGGEDKVLSIYMVDHDVLKESTPIYRYQIRKDGFASRYGNMQGKMVVTKEFVCDGEQLSINFATSAKGYLKIKVVSEDGEVATSGEHFGDKTDRKIKLDKDLKDFKGKKVHLEIELHDAHIYSAAII